MSSNKNKKYWKNLAELNPLNNSALESLGQKEFVEEIPVDEFLADDKNLSNSSSDACPASPVISTHSIR